MKIRCYICCEKHDFDYIIIHINEMHVIRDLSLQEPLTYAVTSCLNYANFHLFERLFNNNIINSVDSIQVKVILYFEDISTNNICRPHANNANFCHALYKLLSSEDVKYSDKEGSKLVHFRTFGLSLAKEAKKEGYESFIQFCVQKFKDRIVNINEKINIQLKIWCVVGRRNSCRACSIIPYHYKNFTTCESVRKFLKTHEIPNIPLKNNFFWDPFHDLYGGVVANILHSSIFLYLIVTKKNTLEFNNQILEIINEFKTKALNSVILNDFFQLTTIRKKINKKSKFLLSGEQTYLLFQIFRHYLKQIGIFEDVVRKSSIIQGMIGLLNSLLNICYLLEDIKKSSDEIATCIDYCIDDFFKFLHIALPNYILSYKYHIIMHYKDWIEHFGHPIQFSTMRYESAHKCVKEA